REMLADELAPYRREDGMNVRLSGPAVSLGARVALVLGMAFHELATNAAKYGSLSGKRGSVDVRWLIEVAPRRLRLVWSEQDGAPVSGPARSGFGRLLLERALAADLHGEARLEFAPDGLQYTLVVPLEETDVETVSAAA